MISLRTRADLTAAIDQLLDNPSEELVEQIRAARAEAQQHETHRSAAGHLHVVCAAIWVETDEPMHNGPGNLQRGVFIAGRSHAQCVPAANAVSEDQSLYHQGFLLSNNRWATRAAAYMIALGAGQVIHGHTYHYKNLFSEDLYDPPALKDG